jgi:hypothetical protein
MEKVFPFPFLLREKGNNIFNYKIIFVLHTPYQVKIFKHARQALPVQDQLFNASRLPVPASVLPQRLQQVASPSHAL